VIARTAKRRTAKRVAVGVVGLTVLFLGFLLTAWWRR
jgi:hypothetical protein